LVELTTNETVCGQTLSSLTTPKAVQLLQEAFDKCSTADVWKRVVCEHCEPAQDVEGVSALAGDGDEEESVGGFRRRRKKKQVASESQKQLLHFALHHCQCTKRRVSLQPKPRRTNATLPAPPENCEIKTVPPDLSDAVSLRQAQRTHHRTVPSDTTKLTAGLIALFCYPHPASITAGIDHPRDLSAALTAALSMATKAAPVAVDVDASTADDILDISAGTKRSREDQPPDLRSNPRPRSKKITSALVHRATTNFVFRSGDRSLLEMDRMLNDSCVDWVSG
jgi:hypothetical protein